MKKNSKQVDRILAAVTAYGCQPADLRDAAHEAHHALHAKVRRGRWDRETIHRKLLGISARTKGAPEVVFAAGKVYEVIKYNRPGTASHDDLTRFEIEARAVEQIVARTSGSRRIRSKNGRRSR